MNSFRNLNAYIKAKELVSMVYALIKKFPKEEQYALCDQLRRAVISIPSNIAEGNGRKSKIDYVRFLDISRGSLYELETQIYIGVMLNFFKENETQTVFLLITEINKMITSLITKLGK